jgi:hypothetical protein
LRRLQKGNDFGKDNTIQIKDPEKKSSRITKVFGRKFGSCNVTGNSSRIQEPLTFEMMEKLLKDPYFESGEDESYKREETMYGRTILSYEEMTSHEPNDSRNDCINELFSPIKTGSTNGTGNRF